MDRSSTTSEFHARMLIRRFIFSDALLCQSRVQVFFPFFWRCDFTSAISSVFSANARENEIFCATRRLVQSAAERSREKPVEGRDKARHFHERAETPTARMGATTSMNIITLEATDEDDPRCVPPRRCPRSAAPCPFAARESYLQVSFCTPICTGLSRPALAGARLTSHPPRRTAARPEPFRDHAPRGRPRVRHRRRGERGDHRRVLGVPTRVGLRGNGSAASVSGGSRTIRRRGRAASRAPGARADDDTSAAHAERDEQGARVLPPRQPPVRGAHGRSPATRRPGSEGGPRRSRLTRLAPARPPRRRRFRLGQTRRATRGGTTRSRPAVSTGASRWTTGTSAT